MPRLNCWEHKKCGRQPGGAKAKELGVCPASTETRANGTNRGRNGGRACWAIAGTFCEGQVQGVFVTKLANCMQCDFYRLVRTEEGTDHESAKDVLAKLK